MKTFQPIVIVATIAATWIVASIVHGGQSRGERGREHEWLIRAVHAPVRLALQDIQADMNVGRYQLAKAKIGILIDTWQGVRLFHGIGYEDILRAFDKVDTNSIVAHPEQSDATNGSHQ